MVNVVGIIFQHKPEDPDAEARVNAVRGLVFVCETLIGKLNQNLQEEISLYFLIKNEVMQTLFKELDDYSVDNRGDVGSWVREAAMEGLERCSSMLCRRDSVGFMNTPNAEQLVELPDKELATHNLSYPLLDTNVVTYLVGGIAKQAVEKMDKLRDTAARTLQRILYNKQYFIPNIPHREILQDIIPYETNLKWGVSSQ